MFREFCAKTFLAGETRFDNGMFEEYFNDLHTIQTLDNIKKCTLKAFQHDCCACACMMYEEDEDYYYIDEAFQEFLFAEYYRYGASEKEAEDLVEILNDQSLEDYQTLDAFELLYQRAREFGGMVSGEHGIGYAKKQYLEKQVGANQIELMRKIKKVFDPDNILNPGKVV